MCTMVERIKNKGSPLIRFHLLSTLLITLLWSPCYDGGSIISTPTEPSQNKPNISLEPSVTSAIRSNDQGVSIAYTSDIITSAINTKDYSRKSPKASATSKYITPIEDEVTSNSITAELRNIITSDTYSASNVINSVGVTEDIQGKLIVQSSRNTYRYTILTSDALPVSDKTVSHDTSITQTNNILPSSTYIENDTTNLTEIRRLKINETQFYNYIQESTGTSAYITITKTSVIPSDLIYTETSKITTAPIYKPSIAIKSNGIQTVIHTDNILVTDINDELHTSFSNSDTALRNNDTLLSVVQGSAIVSSTIIGNSAISSDLITDTGKVVLTQTEIASKTIDSNGVIDTADILPSETRIKVFASGLSDGTGLGSNGIVSLSELKQEVIRTPTFISTIHVSAFPSNGISTGSLRTTYYQHREIESTGILTLDHTDFNHTSKTFNEEGTSGLSETTTLGSSDIVSLSELSQGRVSSSTFFTAAEESGIPRKSSETTLTTIFTPDNEIKSDSLLTVIYTDNLQPADSSSDGDTIRSSSETTLRISDTFSFVTQRNTPSFITTLEDSAISADFISSDSGNIVFFPTFSPSKTIDSNSIVTVIGTANVLASETHIEQSVNTFTDLTGLEVSFGLSHNIETSSFITTLYERSLSGNEISTQTLPTTYNQIINTESNSILNPILTESIHPSETLKEEDTSGLSETVSLSELSEGRVSTSTSFTAGEENVISSNLISTETEEGALATTYNPNNGIESNISSTVIHTDNPLVTNTYSEGDISSSSSGTASETSGISLSASQVLISIRTTEDSAISNELVSANSGKIVTSKSLHPSKTFDSNSLLTGFERSQTHSDENTISLSSFTRLGKSDIIPISEFSQEDTSAFSRATEESVILTILIPTETSTTYSSSAITGLNSAVLQTGSVTHSDRDTSTLSDVLSRTQGKLSTLRSRETFSSTYITIVDNIIVGNVSSVEKITIVPSSTFGAIKTIGIISLLTEIYNWTSSFSTKVDKDTTKSKDAQQSLGINTANVISEVLYSTPAVPYTGRSRTAHSVTTSEKLTITPAEAVTVTSKSALEEVSYFERSPSVNSGISLLPSEITPFLSPRTVFSHLRTFSGIKSRPYTSQNVHTSVVTIFSSKLSTSLAVKLTNISSAMEEMLNMSSYSTTAGHDSSIFTIKESSTTIEQFNSSIVLPVLSSELSSATSFYTYPFAGLSQHSHFSTVTDLTLSSSRSYGDMTTASFIMPSVSSSTPMTKTSTPALTEIQNVTSGLTKLTSTLNTSVVGDTSYLNSTTSTSTSTLSYPSSDFISSSESLPTTEHAAQTSSSVIKTTQHEITTSTLLETSTDFKSSEQVTSNLFHSSSSQLDNIPTSSKPSSTLTMPVTPDASVLEELDSLRSQVKELEESENSLRISTIILAILLVLVILGVIIMIYRRRQRNKRRNKRFAGIDSDIADPVIQRPKPTFGYQESREFKFGGRVSTATLDEGDEMSSLETFASSKPGFQNNNMDTES